MRRPLDPARPGGTQIDVHYVVVPAMARRKLPDPVFLLAGGPGQSAIGVAPSAMGLFARLNNRRDIVFVDQRGTGRSAPLVCEPSGSARHLSLAEQADPARQLAELRECRTRLQTLPHANAPGDLRYFTTLLASQDLDAVRRQLGAERINLVGASYGTRAGLDYLRQFPQAVRRLLIDGVVPPDMALPASAAANAQAALDALLNACQTEAACGQAHPTLRADWQELLTTLPRPVTVRHPLTGQTERFTLTREMALGAVRSPLYLPVLASALPQAISDAARGQFDGLVGLASMSASRQRSDVAMGMHFSVVCSEDLPLMAAAPASATAAAAAAPAAAAASAFTHSAEPTRYGAPDSPPGAPADRTGDFGDQFARQYQAVCADWPRGEVPAAFYRVPASRSPVLLLSGGLDPATPPRHGERVARALGAQARHVVVPNAGHGVLGLSCMRDVLFRFIDASDDPAALAVDATCAATAPRPLAFEPVALSHAPTPPTGSSPRLPAQVSTKAFDGTVFNGRVSAHNEPVK